MTIPFLCGILSQTFESIEVLITLENIKCYHACCILSAMLSKTTENIGY